MRTYSRERKEALLKKLHPPENLTYREVSKAEGIPVSTLYTWQKQQEEAGGMVYQTKNESTDWTAEARFGAIVETATLSESSLSEYCREKGLYPEQLKEWKTAFINPQSVKSDSGHQKQSKEYKKRITQLEKDLRRKEKALAEAAALLILRKKLQTFYEEGGEED
jgi:transposase